MDTKANKMLRFIEVQISLLEAHSRSASPPIDRIDGELHAYKMCLSEMKVVFEMSGC